MWTFAKMGAAFTTGLFTVLLFQIPIQVPEHHWRQPNTVSYGSNEPYSVHIVDVSSFWDIAERHQNCSVRVIADLHGGPSGYGHYTVYRFHNYSSSEDYFDRCSIEWTPDGVAILEPTGHKLFIPKSSFIGGR